jgi:hypothetical protein
MLFLVERLLADSCPHRREPLRLMGVRTHYDTVSSCVLPQPPADSTVADNTGVHELLWECTHIQLEIVHDLTFSQQGVYFPACFRASSSCNMWDQSIEKLIEEVNFCEMF